MVSFGPFFLIKLSTLQSYKSREKVPNLIDRLHRLLMGFDKTREPSFRKRPERTSIPAALRTFVILKIFSMSVPVVYVK